MLYKTFNGEQAFLQYVVHLQVVFFVSSVEKCHWMI